MKLLPFHLQTAVSDLIDRAHLDAREPAFPTRGSFQKMRRRGRSYWYHVAHDAASPSRKKATYVGRVGDATVDAVVAREAVRLAGHKERRGVVAALKRAGLPSPTPTEAVIVAALARAGAFDDGGCLMGTLAFQTYPALLGVVFGGGVQRWYASAALADDRRIEVGLGRGGVDIEAVLNAVDPTFRACAQPDRPEEHPARFENGVGQKIEVTWHEGAVGGIPGLFVRGSVRGVLLHDSGIAVAVPDPARFVIHQIGLAAAHDEGGDAARSAAARASAMIRALALTRADRDLAPAWIEARSARRGEEDDLLCGARCLDDEARKILLSAVGPVDGAS